MRNKAKKNIMEFELEEGINNESLYKEYLDEDADREKQRIQKRSLKERICYSKRNILLFGFILLLIIFSFSSLLYIIFYQESEKSYEYNGQQIENCPSNTKEFEDEKMCFDSCPSILFNREGKCVTKCLDSEFQIDNQCVQTTCSQDKSHSNRFLNEQNQYYDFSSHQCVDECSSSQFNFFGSFCFPNNCPSNKIFQIISQYISKREKNDIKIQTYDTLAHSFQNIDEYELIINEDKKNQICQLGCQNVNQQFIIFNYIKQQHECSNKCPSSNYIYKKGNQQICLDKCPPNSYYSVDKKFCLESCGELLIQQQNCVKNCYDNQVIDDNKCVFQCPSHKPFINKYKKCISCPSSLPYFQDGECVQNCSQNYFLYQNTCSQNCPNNFYKNMQDSTCIDICPYFQTQDHECYQKCPQNMPYNHDKQCLQTCPANLYILIDQNQNQNCIQECPQSYYITPNNHCVSECPLQFFINEQMRRCVESCITIPDEQRICKNKCQENERFIAASEKCVEYCPPSYFKNEETNECLMRCPQYYYKSLQREQICTKSCFQEQKFLQQNECINECPNYTYDNTCVNKCPNNSPLIDGKSCVSECSIDKLNYFGQCLDKCPSNLYYDGDSKECLKFCPLGQYGDFESKQCQTACNDLILDNKYCVKECPFNSIKINNICQSNNQFINGPYLDESGDVIKDCNFDEGHYTQNRVCKKCNGNDGCKKCSQLFGLCTQCKEHFSLFNNECVVSCPKGYIDKSGICIKDDQFLKKSLFFREYGDSQYLNPNQKVQFSVLQNVDYLNSLEKQKTKFRNTLESQIQYNTVIIFLNDMNSTYVNFYQDDYKYANKDEQMQILNNLKSAVLEYNLSILTVQSYEILYFDSFFKLILNEILPSIGYFNCDIIFLGSGYAANSIQKSLSRILLSKTMETSYRNLFGNYLIDLQFKISQEEIMREFTNEQLEEYQNFPQTPEDLELKYMNEICQLIKPYLKLVDVTQIKQNQFINSQKSMSDTIVNLIQSNKCKDSKVKPANMIQDFQNYKKNQNQQFNKNEYFSEQRKSLIYHHISKDFIKEVIQWKQDQNY